MFSSMTLKYVISSNNFVRLVIDSFLRFYKMVLDKLVDLNCCAYINDKGYKQQCEVNLRVFYYRLVT